MSTVTPLTSATFADVTRTGVVLVDFWAPWCGPCKMQLPILEQWSTEHPTVTVGKVNVDEEPELASQFGVRSIPTIVVLRDGARVYEKAGTHSPELLTAAVSHASGANDNAPSALAA